MGFNLVSVLTNKDKELITQYVHSFGVVSDFIGVDEWLRYWGANKIKMYKLLGNQLTYKVPFCFQKDEQMLYQQISAFVKQEMMYDPFNSITENSSFFNILDKLDEVEDHFDISSEGGGILVEEKYGTRNFTEESLRIAIRDLCTICNINANKSSYTIRLSNKPTNKTLTIQAGAKVIKTLGKILNFIKSYVVTEQGKYYYNLLVKKYEKIRIKHSMILNDKTVKGNLVFSIHPLDFMTMSDNSLNWQSCMSWQNEGCYRIGTVEMMNSNNVICCYIEDEKNPFEFQNQATGEVYFWNNKKWRQLEYVNPDIIMTGKAYPYQNNEISKIVLNELRELAHKNLKWKFMFGPEEYKDMKYINSTYAMNRARDYRNYPNCYGGMHKKNILFDTHGMYNDVLNDHATTYWCVRNAVDKTKIINVSGPNNCLCCNEPVSYLNNYEDQYNERYANTGNVVCNDCVDAFFTCHVCGGSFGKDKYVTLSNGNRICKDCAKRFVKECPICNQPFAICEENRVSRRGQFAYMNHVFLAKIPIAPEEEDSISAFALKELYPQGNEMKYYNEAELFIDNKTYIPIFGHYKCLKEVFPEAEERSEYKHIHYWSSREQELITNYVVPFENKEKTLFIMRTMVYQQLRPGEVQYTE